MDQVHAKPANRLWGDCVDYCDAKFTHQFWDGVKSVNQLTLVRHFPIMRGGSVNQSAGQLELPVAHLRDQIILDNAPIFSA